MKRILVIFLFCYIWLYANSYALVIGVNGNGLVGAENDAKVMQGVLVKRGVKNITLLTNTKASKRGIINAFASIANSANSGDYVYLFFSGHGTNENDPNIDIKLKRKLRSTGGLLPYGVKKIDYNSIIVIKRDLVKYFKELDRKGVKSTIIFDACFAGGSFKDFQNSKKGHLSLYANPTRDYRNYPYNNIIFLSASTKFDVTAESNRYKRGFFSMAVSKCLSKHSQFNRIKSCINKEYKFSAVILSKQSQISIFPL